jgi:[ribosomal protein S18]-alanine N-acetyltransferase
MKTSVKVKAEMSWMMPTDLDAVMSVDREAFTELWARKEFKRCMKSVSTSGRVARVDGKVVGFCIYELHPNRFHVLRMAVSEAYRLSGIGSALIDGLKRRLSDSGRSGIACELRETDVTSQVFLRSLGFKARRILREYYGDTGEDGYAMEYRR